MGNKITSDDISAKLNDAYQLIGRAIVIDPVATSADNRETRTTPEFGTPSNPAKKRKFKPSPAVETTNRFEALAPEDTNLIDPLDEADDEDAVHPSGSTTSSSFQKQTSRMAWQLSQLIGPQPSQQKAPEKLNIHVGISKPFWKVKVRPETETLVISDSNLKLVEAADIPENWQLDVFGGAKFGHVAQIIKNLGNKAPKRIVTSVGINHRNHTYATINRESCRVREAAQNRTSEFFAVGVATPGTLPPSEEEALQRTNERLLQTYTDKYIQPPTGNRVRTGDDGIHYTTETTKTVWNNILTALHAKN